MGAGKRVTLRHAVRRTSRPYMVFTGEASEINRELRSRGRRDHPQPRRARDRAAATLRRRQRVDAATRSSWTADAVVLVTQREPIDELYRELDADRDRLKRGGDRGALSDRRLRRAAADRRLHLRRPPARARDRHRRIRPSRCPTCARSASRCPRTSPRPEADEGRGRRQAGRRARGRVRAAGGYAADRARGARMEPQRVGPVRARSGAGAARRARGRGGRAHGRRAGGGGGAARVSGPGRRSRRPDLGRVDRCPSR